MTQSAGDVPSQILAIDGIRIGVTQAGIKRREHDDLTVVELASGSVTSAVFTQNAFRAAPVEIAEANLIDSAHSPGYWVINTGYANAGTGPQGAVNAQKVCRSIAQHAGTDEHRILPFSTGVIGEHLPTERIIGGIQGAFDDLSANGWARAAGAILTTDTRPKVRSAVINVKGQRCVITGMAKGAGMICPNMATMLAFVGTDAGLPYWLLQALWREVVAHSFNRISVDGDTSTNDAAVICSTGRGPLVIGDENAPGYRPFKQALVELASALAKDIIRDGEGATKFVEVHVAGGNSIEECDSVARTIAHSPLVKTALFASDPNWGRLLAAIGRADVKALDVSRVSLSINGIEIAAHGARSPRYDEALVKTAMAGRDLVIGVALGRGLAEATLWTTDLSYDYVRINAEYRT